MKTSDFNYDLPERLIAQSPMPQRDMARLMVIDRETGAHSDHVFREFPQFLSQGDVLVLNDTRVIPARLLGEKEGTGVPCEILLLRRLSLDTWDTLVRPGVFFCTHWNLYKTYFINYPSLIKTSIYHASPF